jgi:hypothetical protein
LKKIIKIILKNEIEILKTKHNLKIKLKQAKKEKYYSSK